MERPPKIELSQLFELFTNPLPDEMRKMVEDANVNYDYWTKVKYQRCPAPFTSHDLWTAIGAARLMHDQEVWKEYGVHFGLTNEMQRQCHELDLYFGGAWGMNDVIQDAHKERYLVSSLMEEAISSSQMEGAATTRKVAKEMLRNKISPKDKSQQMIHNNYQTIRFIVENKDKDINEALLLQIHRLMTERTLDRAEDAGRFRMNDDVVVANGITKEVVYTPPSFKDISRFVQHLCEFFNDSSSQREFIHPIIRAIVVHFMVSFMHPFVDGNGRTARALFYWYMLKHGYWLTEYLSISRIIYKSKASYENSFLYTEYSNNDMGYFIAYNLRVLGLAFKELQRYINVQNEKREKATSFLRLGRLSERQAMIIKEYYDHPKTMLTVKDVQGRFSVTPTTAKSDIMGLVEQGFLAEIPLNKIKRGYVKGTEFDSRTKGLKL